MSTAPAEQPIFLIIAGPNGSGKSTAYEQSLVEAEGRSFRIINPDLFAKRLVETEQLDLASANILAVQRIEAWLETSILAGHTVGVETVLSTDKYRRLVDLAKSVGYQFRLIYIMLDNPDLNVERVRLRVQSGGHAVPEDKIRARYHRSLEQLRWFIRRADDAVLYDNSGAQPRLVGQKEDGITWLDVNSPATLLAALDPAR